MNIENTKPNSSQSGGHQSYTNTASPYSFVGMQAGVIHGDAHLYHIPQDASPAEKFQRGVNYLNGRMARQAESLIHEAVADGYETVGEGYVSEKVGYYWALAILSGKSFNHLGQEDFPKLRTAFSSLEKSSSNERSTPLDFISKLLTYLHDHDDSREPNHTELGSVLRSYTDLNPQHQEEIQRHLDIMLTEAIQGHSDLLEEEKVRNGRMGNARRDRVWKFFQAEPTPPKTRTPQSPQIGLHHWAILICGTLFCSLGAIWESKLLMQEAPLRGGVIIALIVGSLRIAVRLSLDTMAVRHRRNMNERERLDFLRDSGALDSKPTKGTNAKSRFMRQVSSSIAYYFRKYRPNGVARSEWESKTTPIRRELHYQMTKLYSDSGATVNSLNWLIRWHARKAAHELKARKDSKVGRRARLLWQKLLLMTSCSVLIVASLVTLAITAGIDPRQALSAFALTALGCGFAIPRATRIYGEKKRHVSELAEYSDLFRDERKEYHRWLARLEDRPTDLEMARWLDYDKTYIKSWGMKKYGITNREVISHVTLIESVSKSKRARIVSGPFRYSNYSVHVFLLTEGGLRLMSADLNFLTGELSNITRTIFRYDAMASAGIIEIEARRGRRWSVSAFSAQALHISLVSGEWFDMVFVAFDEDSTDSLDDLDELREHSQDASGATDALRILEAVAADGKDWLTREQMRRQRRLRYDEDKSKFHEKANGEHWKSPSGVQSVPKMPISTVTIPGENGGQKVALQPLDTKPS